MWLKTSCSWRLHLPATQESLRLGAFLAGRTASIVYQVRCSILWHADRLWHRSVQLGISRATPVSLQKVCAQQTDSTPESRPSPVTWPGMSWSLHGPPSWTGLETRFSQSGDWFGTAIPRARAHFPSGFLGFVQPRICALQAPLAGAGSRSNLWKQIWRL